MIDKVPVSCAKMTFIITLFLHIVCVSARAQAEDTSLPTTEQFNAALTTCATNSNVSVSADLLGSVKSIYDGQRTNGTANLGTATKFLELFPEADRKAVYELYTKCIDKILAGKSFTTREPLQTSPAEPAGLKNAGTYIVLFDRKSADLDTRGEEITDEAAAKVLSVLQDGKVISVRITGLSASNGADNSAGDATPDFRSLAQDRAQMVANELIKARVPPEVLHQVSYVVNSFRGVDRRVEITLRRPPSDIP